ncbi:MAG: DUF4125 family protein [Clostridia bacterium]
MNEKIINEIIEREWAFFDKVEHVDGRASCQNNWDDFVKYRKAQFDVFEGELLESYLADLKQYEQLEYNPIMLKYAYMMESTEREEFEKFSDKLPKIGEEKAKIIEEIIKIELSMRIEFEREFPNLSSTSRAVFTENDSKYSSSFETYLRGELSTYSPKTLYLYAKCLLNLMNTGENMIRIIQENTVKNFGFSSLQEAENR